MAKSKRRQRKEEEEESSSEESEYDSESGSYDSGSEYDTSSDYDSESGSGSSAEEDEDHEQLLEVLTRAGMKPIARKLISNKVYTVAKARDMPSSKLVKFGLKEAQVKTLKKLLSNPENLLPPESSDEEESGGEASESEDEDEAVWRVLRSIDETGVVKLFKKGKITNLEKAYKLTDKKLKNLGVESKEAREKILREFSKRKNNETSSEEDDEVKLAKIMKGIDMKQYIKNLQKGKITDLESSYTLTSSTLKSLGVASKRDRKKILSAITKYKDSHAEEDPGLQTLKKALTKLGLKKYYSKLKANGVDNVKKIKKIDHKELRDVGVQMYRERREILDKIGKINDDGTVEVEEGSEAEEVASEGEGDSNVVSEILRQLYMTRHIPDFKRANITTLKEARKLTQTQLRAMGIGLYLDREKVINAFQDYRPKNQAIMNILIDNNLAKHMGEFEKLIDIEEARALTHADLRAMGLNLYGQRDRLMKAFASFNEAAEKSDSDSGSESGSGSDSASGSKSRSRSKSKRSKKK